MNDTNSFPALTLADGTTYLLHATDKESELAITRLTDLMCLGKAGVGHKIFVSVTDPDEPKAYHEISLPRDDVVQVCIIPRNIDNSTMGIIQMDTIARKFALLALPKGAILLHGALACIKGEGVLLVARSGTGKTTASNRFPPPWRSLSDDGTFVVKDAKGNYFAHPWPTWSRLFSGETGCKWHFGEFVPLVAIFALSQAEVDSAVSLDYDQSLASLIESNNQILGMRVRRELNDKDTEIFTNMQFSALSNLARVVPAYKLNISLTGKFWEVISDTINTLDTSSDKLPVSKEGEKSDLPTDCPGMDGSYIPIVVSGCSMLPTLCQSELLEVIPYGSDNTGPMVGDVICFFSSKKNYRIVHRVIKISEEGIVTRGDNNWAADSYPVLDDEIIGKVAFTWREGKRREIPGGFYGRVIHRTLKARKRVLRLASPVVRLISPVIKVTRSLPDYFPGLSGKKVVVYSTGHRRVMRLFIRGKTAGEFDSIRGIWNIRYPYTLFVDSESLPKIERAFTRYNIEKKEQ